MQKYEHGENRLSASRLFRAAKLLGHPVSFFFDELQTTAPDTDGAGLSRDEINLLRDFRRIASENVRDHLLQVAKGIADAGVSVMPGRGIRNSS